MPTHVTLSKPLSGLKGCSSFLALNYQAGRREARKKFGGKFEIKRQWVKETQKIQSQQLAQGKQTLRKFKVHKLHTLNKPSGNAEAVRDRVHKSQPQDKPSGNSAMYKQLERLEYLAVIEL